MRHRSFASLLSFALTSILAACTLQTAAPPAPPAAPPTIPASPSSAPAAPAAEVAAGEPLVPVMEVGSTFRLFTGGDAVAVPAGPFIMGNGRPESPVRTVTLDDFWIDQTEVTNRMYTLCVELGQCTPPDPTDNPAYPDVRRGDLPVVGVNWQQAADYCAFAGGRLPWEAEWEKAARGPEGNTFPWGEKQPVCDLLNFDGCVRKASFVGTYPDGKSYYDAVDMSGNAFEWVADWYLTNYYGAAPAENPQGPDQGKERSVRSSAFNTDGYLTEAARRSSAKPESHRADLGFRCAYDDPAYYAPFCTALIAYGSNASGGAGSGETLNEKCSLPQLENLELDCNQTNVWVDSNGGGISSSSGLDGCLDGGLVMHNGVEQHLYTCPPGTPPVLVCGTCEYPQPSGGASCPDGYHQSGTQCVIDQGTPGLCPPGSEFDETMKCCSALPGSGASYDLCPPGMSYIPGPNPGDPGSCVDYVAGGIKCAPMVVDFKTGCGDGNQPDCAEHPDDPRCGSCDPATNPNGCGPGGTLICPAENQCYCS